MNQPTVSIIINNYNYARFLHQAIESALNQTYGEIDVIVVDDGSQDRSQEIINSYGSKILPIFKQNGGQASAFNAGFVASSGEIILFLDADDYLLPHTVAQVVSVWEPDTSKVHYPLAIIDAVGKRLGTHPQQIPLPSGQVWPQLLNQGRYLTPVTSGNAFARDVLNRILPMPEAEYRIAADGYLTTLAPFYGQVIALSQVQGVYRIHGGNLWAVGREANVERYCQFVQHDLQRYQLLEQTAQSFGYSVTTHLWRQDYLHLKHCLLSLRMAPQQHPISQDSRWMLVIKGIIVACQDSSLEPSRRVWRSLWFIWMGSMPLGTVKLTHSSTIQSVWYQLVQDKLSAWCKKAIATLKPSFERIG